jgi:transcriptional regulator with XRE-family HTH domain
MARPRGEAAPTKVGKLIRRCREKEGLHQTDVAAMSGVYQATISDIERGVRDPKIETVEKILIAMGYDFQYRAVRRIGE